MYCIVWNYEGGICNIKAQDQFCFLDIINQQWNVLFVVWFKCVTLQIASINVSSKWEWYRSIYDNGVTVNMSARLNKMEKYMHSVNMASVCIHVHSWADCLTHSWIYSTPGFIQTWKLILMFKLWIKDQWSKVSCIVWTPRLISQLL